MVGERFWGSDCGTVDSNISDRRSVEYVRFASSAGECYVSFTSRHYASEKGGLTPLKVQLIRRAFGGP